MKIAIGGDHAAYELKDYLLAELRKRGHEMTDCGTNGPESVDYPDFARCVCDRVVDGKAERGIVLCSTGIGISIAANKIHGIRAALCHTEFSARMARLHNDANVLALGAGIVGKLLALSIAETFLAEKFSHGERHIRRIGKIMSLEDDVSCG